MNSSCNFVIFGGTGDLATRKLLPSLYYLHCDGYLPGHVKIYGVGRSDYNDDSYRNFIADKLKQCESLGNCKETSWQEFSARLFYQKVDGTKTEDFSQLGKRLALKEDNELVCYLSTSPNLFGDICRHLNEAGLVKNNTRVVLEKPVGHCLKSSRIINDAVAKIFVEENIFRIDHYLGKETVQNILALRFANSMFEPLWNSREIDHVQISISETVGVEGRWSYYNDSGAFRDMVQSHILQLLALVAMEPPRHFEPDAVRNEKVKVLRSLRPISGAQVLRNSIRGQYSAGSIDGQPVPGYLEAEGNVANPQTETFVALRAHIDNWRWAGVPFYLRSGKRMSSRNSEIYIQFKEVPYSIFSKSNSSTLRPNKLIIQLQPEEAITLTIMNKVPGLAQKGIEMREVDLNLNLSAEVRKETRRMAYQRLLMDIIHNDTTLFVRRDEVEAAWTWADPILEAWQNSAETPKPYAAGSWGPSAAYALTEKHGHSWHDEYARKRKD
ncbi:MAG: glucose-6-phosphate dehydrogenase [Gammaproteobacteria bacterium]|nr:glucose-6-phosphate dehydrogenase [Gammaproteobacteria bacterium]